MAFQTNFLQTPAMHVNYLMLLQNGGLLVGAIYTTSSGDGKKVFNPIVSVFVSLLCALLCCVLGYCVSMFRYLESFVSWHFT